MKKLLILFMLSMILLSITQVYAFFPRSHIAWTVDGFEAINSPLTQKCKPYLNVVLDFNQGSDIGVIYYGSSDQKLIGSYIGTHAKGSGYDTCLANADPNNIGEQCACIGNALHIIQDSYSHNNGGLVEKYLLSQLGSNYFGHMTIEKSFENKHVDLLTKNSDYVTAQGRLDYYDDRVLDTLFVNTTNGLVASSYMKLINDMAGIDMSNTAQIFRSGYQQNGFYNQIYKDKIQLPWWFNGISIGLIIIGLAMGIFILWFGTTKWKYFASLQFFGIGLIGAIIYYSFDPFDIWKYTHFPLPSWQIVTWLIQIPSYVNGLEIAIGFYLVAFLVFYFVKDKGKWFIILLLIFLGSGIWYLFGMNGYLQVSDADVLYYHNTIQKATNDFLQNGILTIDDASGLTYVDSTGKTVTGTLTQAEQGFKNLNYFVLLPLFVIYEIWLIFKSIGMRIKR